MLLFIIGYLFLGIITAMICAKTVFKDEFECLIGLLALTALWPFVIFCAVLYYLFKHILPAFFTIIFNLIPDIEIKVKKKDEEEQGKDK